MDTQQIISQIFQIHNTIPDEINWTVRDYANGCLSDPSPTITIRYSVTPYVYNTNYDITVCKGSNGNTNFYACENDPTKNPSLDCGLGNSIPKQWYKNGVAIQGATTTTYTISNSTATSATYYYTTKSKFGACEQQSAHYTIHVPDVPIVTTTNNVLQIGGNSILNFTNAADFQSINWYYNGKVISTSPVLNVTLPGKYTAEGISSSCGNYITEVIVSLNCGNIIPPRTITVNTTYNTPTTLFDVTINNGATLTVSATTLTMQSCAKITVKTGGSLVINGSKLIGCSEWAGITVEDGGTLTINAQNGNNSEISGAYAGVYYKKIANGNGTINVQYCDFGNNTSHIILIDKTVGTSTFSNCNFYSLNNSPTCGNIANIPTLQNSSVRKQLYIQACNNVHFTQSVFRGQPNVGTAFSRYAVEGYNLTTNNANYNLEVKEFDFNGTYTEAVHLNNSKNINIEGRGSIDNIWGQMDAAIHAIGGSKVAVKNTRISDFTTNPPPITPPITNGILFDQTDECTINNCKFHYCTNGIQYYNTHSNQATTNITENVFFSNQFGLVMASNSYPYTCGNVCNNTNTNVIAVNIGCNNFLHNNIGIYGCGKLNEIGDFNHESGNIMIWSTSSNNNIDWDFLWDDLAGNNSQEKINLLPGAGNSNFYLINNTNHNTLLGTYPMNSTQNFSLTGFKGQTNSNGALCTRNASRPFAPNIAKDEEESQKYKVVIFPNPYTNLFNINITSDEPLELYSIEIYDILGNIVKKTQIQANFENVIDNSELAAGTYILKIYSNTGYEHYYKIYKLNTN